MFTGAQTGAPLPFTSVAGTSVSVPGTAWQAGQPIIFSRGSGTYPSGLTAGQVYYVYNPAGSTFGISAAAGASSPYTGYGSGAGNAATTQFITQAAWTAISLDTEPLAGDPWDGHQTSSSPAYYYAMFPGIYLAEFTFPANGYGTGIVSAGLFTQEGTAPAATSGGQAALLPSAAGSYTSVSVTRLLQFSSAGTYAGPGNNYAAAAAWQSSSVPLTPLATATRYPAMNLEWVAAATGNPGLPVPDNDTWPAPPQHVTAAFVNKNVRDTIGFLTCRPVMEAYYKAGTFMLPPGGTGTVIPLDTAAIDNHGAFTTVPWSMQATVAGVYDVYGQVPILPAPTNTSLQAGLTVVSANYPNGGFPLTIWGPPQDVAYLSYYPFAPNGSVNCAIARRRLRLNRGDTVQLSAWLGDPGTAAAQVLNNNIWAARLITVWRGR